MLKILLVDDEDIIKSGLRNEVDWAAADCVISGEASDGQEALELIHSDPPDVVISDIRMPFKDGLTLMEEARELYPDLFFLFISGHDEFSYVQKALKMGASDYLLKPIDTVYLEESLSKIAAELGSRSRSRAAGRISKRAEIRSFLQDIVFNSLQDEALLRTEAVGIDNTLVDKCFQILSFQIDHYYSYGGAEDDRDQDNIRKSFYEIVRIFDPDNSALLTESLKEFDLCLMSNSVDELKQILEESLLAIQSKIELLPFTISIGIGDVVLHLQKITMSFSQSRKALEMKFIKGDGQIFRIDDVRTFSEQMSKGLMTVSSKDLMEALREGRADDLESLLASVKEDVLRTDDPRVSLNWLASDVLLQLVKLLEDRELSIEEAMDDPMNEWKELSKCTTADHFIERFQGILIPIASYIHIRRDYHSSQILDQTITLINEKFTQGSFSLENAAAHACMSSCYFAVIFKQETGRTFNRFLTDLRINKAKDLILYTDMKSYEIGPKVGYDNASYFSTVFKKVTGFSPSEYRKNLS